MKATKKEVIALLKNNYCMKLYCGSLTIDKIKSILKNNYEYEINDKNNYIYTLESEHAKYAQVKNKNNSEVVKLDLNNTNIIYISVFNHYGYLIQFKCDDKIYSSVLYLI